MMPCPTAFRVGRHSCCAVNNRHLGTHATLWKPRIAHYDSGRLRRNVIVQGSSKGDFFKEFFDFSKWGQTRTAKAWRLRQYDAEQNVTSDVTEVNPSQQLDPPSVPQRPKQTEPLPAPVSIVDMQDTELSTSLTKRLAELGGLVDDDDTDEAVPLLTGQELRSLIYQKYSKTYDVSFARRDIPGRTLVSLNIMWNHLEQRSFQLTEEQYMQKLDSIAYLVNAVQRTQLVRSFLEAPAKSSRGLPARPVVGCAVSVRLDLDEEDIQEWFSQGYQ